MPFLHAHRRRVPAQDVDRSVVVGVGAEATMATEKDRLAFAALPVHGSAFRTGLRGVGGIDVEKIPAAFFELVGEDGFEAEPTLIEDAPVQSGLLPDHAARFLDGSARGSRHVFDLQIFQNDGSETIGDAQSRLVRPVFPDAGTASREFGGASQRLGPPDRAALAPRGDALCGTLATFNGFERGGDGQMLSSGERQRVGDAAINADARADIGRNDILDLAGEADVPAKRIERDGDVLDRASQRARVAELHPADLGQAHGGPFGVEPLRLDLASLKAEGVVDAAPAGRRKARAACEEIGERSIEIAQSLLLAGLRNSPHPVVFGAKQRQFPRLSDIVQLPSGLSLKLTPEIAPLFQRQIVDEAAHASELPEQDFLFGGRIELVAKAAKDHAVALGLWSGRMSENTEIRKGRHVVYALHAHLVFVTKYRRDALSELAIRDLRTIFAKVCTDFEAELIECNGEDDHVHLLIVYPPKVALSKLVNSLKGVSSRLLREWRPEVRGRYKDGVLWSPSYFVASCGGAPLSIIADYVKSQREAPSGRSRLPPRPEGRGFSRGSR